MPRALEVLDHTVQQLERGEIGAVEAIDTLLAEEFTGREGPRVKAALRMARLSTVKTLQGFDFSFQPSLDRGRILALAQLAFIERNEVVHLLGPPGTGKSHLAIALGVEAVQRRAQRLLLAARRHRGLARPRRARGDPARAHPVPLPGVAADRR